MHFHGLHVCLVPLSLLDAAAQEAHTDTRQLVVSTPAFMYGEAPIHEVFDGIGVLVARVLSLVK